MQGVTNVARLFSAEKKALLGIQACKDITNTHLHKLCSAAFITTQPTNG